MNYFLLIKKLYQNKYRIILSVRSTVNSFSEDKHLRIGCKYFSLIRKEWTLS